MYIKIRLLSSLVALLALFCVGLPVNAQAENTLPAPVTTQLHTPVAKVGDGTYRKFGFSVYNATLWAPDGAWSADKPYALQLHYTRSLSKETLVDTVMDDIRDQDVADDATLANWEKMLNATLPAIADGDTIIGVAIPGKKSLLFYNGKKLASIDDPVFSKAFFNIWLGDNADEDLRGKLLASAK